MSILDTILKEKQREVKEAESLESFAVVRGRAEQVGPIRGFRRALCAMRAPAIIAEIKRASPSKGIIRERLLPVEVAEAYLKAGAACLSVLTDRKFFQGSLEELSSVRRAVPEIPILRKDFIISPYQVWETRAVGADAVLLIVKALSSESFRELYRTAVEAGLDILVEVHDEDELRRALRDIAELSSLGANFTYPIIGINNRNLTTFETSLQVSERVAGMLDGICNELLLPRDKIVLISESGISNPEDLLQLLAVAIEGFLIGESLLTHGDPGENLSHLIGSTRRRL